MIAAAAQTASWTPAIVAFLTGSSLVGLVTLWVNRKGRDADTTATIVTASGEVVKLSSGLLATYVQEVQRLAERVARLEGLLDQRDRENHRLLARCHQLEEFIRSMNLPVPHAVIDMGDDG